MTGFGEITGPGAGDRTGMSSTRLVTTRIIRHRHLRDPTMISKAFGAPGAGRMQVQSTFNTSTQLLSPHYPP